MHEKKIGFGGWLVRVVALGYPLALLAVTLGLRLIGERWWVTTVLLYMPLGFLALPLVVILPWVAIAGPRWLLAPQVGSLVLLLFPLLGFQWSLSRAATPGAAALRVVSYNVAAGAFKEGPLVAQAVAAKPDVVVLQESTTEANEALRAALPGFYFQEQGEFMIASRWLVDDIRERQPAYVRYRLRTPAGPVALFSVHFTSPHRVFEKMRGEGMKRELATGRAFQARAAPLIADNARLRATEAHAAADEAKMATDPVIVAGDTNLPGLSWALGHAFSGYQDGFASAGTGFGYTFPSTKRPWLRLDRVLAGARFRFVRFEVLRPRVSDHYGVVADLELEP